jgi:hypothetical protein
MNLVTRSAGPPLAAVGALLLLGSAAQAKDPWPHREPRKEPRPAHQLRSVNTWPAEPTVLPPIDPIKFKEALASLCEVPADSPVAALAPDFLAAAEETKTDPFTLAALARIGSGCKPKYNKDGVIGMMAVEPGMYRVEGAPTPPVEKTDLTVKRLLDPEVNITVGATLLAMWNGSHAESDAGFGGVPHRSAVAHYVWGDEVRSSGQEDIILTARRRMIARYNGVVDKPRQSHYGIDVVSPLEGIPRVATSGPGDDRSDGRTHKGLDIVATIGEPVRSIADGVVIFAGANMPGRARLGPIPASKIKRYAWRRLGVGGIYLCIEHTPDPRRIVSCYMHLASYNVNERDEVKAGQIIGAAGRTGVKVSPPHLHLEVRVDDRTTNPAKTLGDLVIAPRMTQTYVRVQKAKRLRRLRASLDQAAFADRG